MGFTSITPTQHFSKLLFKKDDINQELTSIEMGDEDGRKKGPPADNLGAKEGEP